MFPQSDPNAPGQAAQSAQVIRLIPPFKPRKIRTKDALSAKAVENALPEDKLYRLYDTEGLYLEVTPSGGKYWRVKYYFRRKERRLALGKYPEVSLAQAREKRDEARGLIEHGVDPFDAKKEQERQEKLKSEMTFELVAREWHELRKNIWTPSYGAEILHRLEMDVFPKIGKLPVASIRPMQVLDMLRHIEKRGAYETARRAKQYCGQIFRYAMRTERAEIDPAHKLEEAMRPFKKGHFAAISADDLPDFLGAIKRNDARLYPQTRNAIRLMMLTMTRTEELIGAQWDEFNFETKIWTIPYNRAKMRRPHLVPLSRQVIAILEDQKRLTGKWEWVFPNQIRPRKHMSNGTILKALERLGYKGRMTGHGFRSLGLSTIKERLGYRHEVPDRQLAHVPGNKVDIAYDRAKFLDERTKMMQDWANYLDKVTNNAGNESSTPDKRKPT